MSWIRAGKELVTTKTSRFLLPSFRSCIVGVILLPFKINRKSAERFFEGIFFFACTYYGTRASLSNLRKKSSIHVLRSWFISLSSSMYTYIKGLLFQSKKREDSTLWKPGKWVLFIMRVLLRFSYLWIASLAAYTCMQILRWDWLIVVISEIPWAVYTVNWFFSIFK